VEGLGGEEGVGETEVMEGAQLKEALAILVELADAKVPDAARPGIVVGSHTGVEVSK